MEINKLLLSAISFVLVLVFGYLAILMYLTWPVSELSIEKAGVFGDSFGILTALFSGLAFSGLIVTLILQSKQLKMQKEDLNLQREELKLTRKELAKTSEAQIQQVKELQEAAKLNALCTLVQVKTDLSMQTQNVIPAGTIHIEDRNKLIEKLEKVLVENDT